MFFFQNDIFPHAQFILSLVRMDGKKGNFKTILSKKNISILHKSWGIPLEKCLYNIDEHLPR